MKGFPYNPFPFGVLKSWRGRREGNYDEINKETYDDMGTSKGVCYFSYICVSA